MEPDELDDMHADGSGWNPLKAIGWKTGTKRELKKLLGPDFEGRVDDFINNSQEMKDIKQFLKTTIILSTRNKILEAADMNRSALQDTLENTSKKILSTLQKANQEIVDMKIKQLEVKESEEDTTNTSSDENGEKTRSNTVPESNAEVEGTIGFADTTNTTQQSGENGLFVMHAPTSPWGGPVQMGIMNSLGSNAHAMCTPTPMCLVHENAHAWLGAQAPCFDAACGPWPPALRNAQAAGCAQPRVCYVLAR